MTTKVLLIDADTTSRNVIADSLRANGYEVTDTSSPADGAVELHKQRFDLLVYDFDSDKSDRVKIAFAVRTTNPTTSVIALTRFPTITADAALFQGAVEFLEKPVDLQTLGHLALCLTSRLCRRGTGMQTWHVCSNCADWPVSDFEELTVNPYDGLELCNECRIMLQHARCH